MMPDLGKRPRNGHTGLALTFRELCRGSRQARSGRRFEGGVQPEKLLRRGRRFCKKAMAESKDAFTSQLMPSWRVAAERTPKSSLMMAAKRAPTCSLFK